MKKLIRGVIASLLLLLLLTLNGCVSSSPNNVTYWFSKVSKEVNLSSTEANSTIWEFTSRNDNEIILSLKMNVDNFSSYAYLYVNDVQVKSETNNSIYTYQYKLSLKKGDKIKIEAKSLYSITEEEYDILMMVISQNGNNYIIEEYDKTK